MADDKIYFDDLFQSDIDQQLNGVRNTLVSVKDALEGMFAVIQKNAQTLQINISNTNNAAASTAKLEQQVQALYDLYSNVSNFLSTVTNDIKQTTEAIEKNTHGLQQNQQAIGGTAQLTQRAQQEIKNLNAALKAFDMQGITQSVDISKASLKELEVAIRQIENWLKTLSATELNVAKQQGLTKHLLELKDAADKMRGANNDVVNSMLKMKKISAEEATNINKLREQVRGMVADANARKAVTWETIDINKTLNGSFNEISTTYSILKEQWAKINRETADGARLSKELGEALHTLRTTMNGLQESTGNYALSVGHYEKAMAGLQFSTQQVMREIPSAQDLQQFFLAISNNIPILVDQMTRYGKTISSVNKDLSGLESRLAALDNERANTQDKGCLEQIQRETEAINQQIDTLKKMPKNPLAGVIKSMLSWQTILLAVLLLLRKLPDLIDKIRQKWDKFAKSVSDTAAKLELMAKAEEDISANVTELNVINTRIKNIEKGTDEWKAAIERVNSITNANLDATSATVGEVQRVTKAYIDQQRQLAVNAQIIAAMSQSDNAKRNLNTILGGGVGFGNTADLRLLMGIQEGDDDDKRLSKLTSRYRKSVSTQNATEAELNRYKGNTNSPHYKAYRKTLEKDRKEVEKIKQEIKEFAQEVIGVKIMSDELYDDYLEELYKSVSDGKQKGGSTTSSGGSASKLTYDDVLAEWWKSRYKIMEEGIEREKKQLEGEYEANKIAENKDYEERQVAFLAYAAQEKLTKEKIQEEMQRIEENHTAMMKGIEKDYLDGVAELELEYSEREIEGMKHRDVVILKMMTKSYEERLTIPKRRVRNIKDEENRNRDALQNIRILEQEIEVVRNYTYALEGLDKVEAEKDREERIKALEQEIEKQRELLDLTKKISKEFSLTDVIYGKIVNNPQGVEGKRGILAALFPDDKETIMAAGEESIEGWFEGLTDRAKEGVEEVYNITTGYINDMIDSYVALQEAKVAAAEESTDAAREAYEKEKALLEAGYANNVESAWREYQEKKKLQEEAERDAEKAAQRQQLLNAAVSASELVKASAEIWAMAAKDGIFAPVVAGGLIAAMWASFLGAQAMAMKVSSTKYGEGTAQLIDYGGSHSSGNDVPLGVDKNGNPERIEKGEIKAVIRKRSVGKYGANNLIDMINSINNGTYVADATATTRRNLSLSVNTNTNTINLDKIERNLVDIKRNGEEKTVIADGYIITTKGNRTRRTKI